MLSLTNYNDSHAHYDILSGILASSDNLTRGFHLTSNPEDPGILGLFLLDLIGTAGNPAGWMLVTAGYLKEVQECS